MHADIEIALGDNDNDVIVALPEDDMQVNRADDSDFVIAVENVAVSSATTSAQLAAIISDETGTGALVFSTSPALSAPVITGGSAVALTSLSLVNSGFHHFLASGGALTANRTLTLNPNDANRTLSMSGDLTIANTVNIGGALSTVGGHALTLTTTNATGITLPTTGTLATLDGVETLTNKSLTSPTITGGIANALTSLSLVNSGFQHFLASGGTLTANRTLTLNLNNANRALSMSGDLTVSNTVSFSGAFSTVGGHAITLTTTNATGITLPTTGTLATLAGTETLTNKSLTSPAITGGSAVALTSLSLVNSGFQHFLATGGTLTANRTLTTNLNDANRALSMSGDLTVSGNATIGNVTVDNSAWTNTTPTVTASAGAFTTVSCQMYHKQIGKTVLWYAAVTVTTVGTASGRVIVPLPVAAARTGACIAGGLNNTTLKGLSGMSGYDTTNSASIVNAADGTFPAASGHVLFIGGSYEAA